MIDIGGDHRFVEGWTYGLADVWPDRIAGGSRIANPGCFPAATLTALAPLLAEGLIEPSHIIIDAKTGISGAGRGGESRFGYAESNENLVPYGLLQHVHMPEMAQAIERLSGGRASGLVFTPHLVPMTRGVLATILLSRSHHHGCVPERGTAVLCGTGIRSRDRQATADEVGDGFEPRVRQLRGRPRARPRHRDGGGRQPRQGRGRSGGAEREPDLRAAGDRRARGCIRLAMMKAIPGQSQTGHSNRRDRPANAEGRIDPGRTPTPDRMQLATVGGPRAQAVDGARHLHEGVAESVELPDDAHILGLAGRPALP